ncbi:hypothetical protein M3Y98_00864400 [Aphelenchoides besseyi]|nr:hypothetical protein M3Y98_00864400 [Aphelenchoides besseyi]
MFWFLLILLSLSNLSSSTLVYDSIGDVVFLSHIQKRCQLLTYDFSSPVNSVSYIAKLLSNLYGSKTYTIELGRLIIAHIQAEVVQTCNPTASSFALDFTGDLRELRVKYGRHNETEDRRLFEPLNFVRHTLKLLRANTTIVGVRGVQISRLLNDGMENTRKLIRIGYHLLKCDVETPKIIYRFCVESVANDQVHVAYRRLTTNRTNSLPTHGNKSADEQVGYAIRVNSSFILIDDCFENPILPSHFKVCITNRCDFQHHGFNNPKSFLTLTCRLNSNGKNEEDVEFADMYELPITETDGLFSKLFDRVLFAESTEFRVSSKKKSRRLVDLL